MESRKLSLGEKFFSIPISLAAIVLGLVELTSSGVTLLSVFPLFVGLENIVFIIYKRNPTYRRIALQTGIFLFTVMAIFLVLY